MTYSLFSNYYDEIIRGKWYSLNDEVGLIQEFIENFWGAWKNILEFACGTGTVAAELKNIWYKVYGVDLSLEMLEQAKQNIWNKNCRIGDMCVINLEKEFDVVLCNYNSICHLTSWKEWQDFFTNASKHLKKWGLLIFDINTVWEFENISRDFAQFYNIGDDTICLEMQKTAWLYEWIVKMFVKNMHWNYDLHIEKILEVSFQIKKIKQELIEQNFEIIHLEDFHKWVIDAESERVYFIASKK